MSFGSSSHRRPNIPCQRLDKDKLYEDFFLYKAVCAFALRLKYWCSVKLRRGVIKILFGRLISWSWFYRSGLRAIISICKPFHILPIWGEKENGCSASITTVPESKALKQTVFSRTEGYTPVLPQWCLRSYG